LSVIEHDLSGMSCSAVNGGLYANSFLVNWEIHGLNVWRECLASADGITPPWYRFEKSPSSTSRNVSNLASFSSRGPTPDGRIKPDVVNIGDRIISARSDGTLGSYQCRHGARNALRESSGTSMATPLTAGAAALLRQYLTTYVDCSIANRNFVPCAFKLAEQEPGAQLMRTPSAALMKALLIAGAVPLTGDNGVGLSVGHDVPNNEQGYGRINLRHSMQQDHSAAQFFLFDAFNHSLVTASDIFAACASVAPGELKVTLVWTDYPGSPSHQIPLVSDLDLFVLRYSGGGWQPVAITNVGPAGSDHTNVVEQVAISSAEVAATLEHLAADGISSRGDDRALYTVAVKSTRLPAGPQPFALVLSGAKGMEVSMGACDEIIDELADGHAERRWWRSHAEKRQPATGATITMILAFLLGTVMCCTLCFVLRVPSRTNALIQTARHHNRPPTIPTINRDALCMEGMSSVPIPVQGPPQSMATTSTQANHEVGEAAMGNAVAATALADAGSASVA